jgi:Ni/Co efflux regulator RcnB
MTKLLAGVAAVGVAALISMGSANAAPEQHRADGMRNSDQIEVSARKRHRHYRAHRYYGPRYGYYGPRYYRPYYDSYAYSPYYRPYYRPGPYIGVGPGGVGFGFGF